MSTEILRPNAAGDECNILGQTGASCPNHYQNVDDVTPDEFDTCVYSLSDIAERDLYNLPDHSVGSGTINSIKVYCRCASSDNLGLAAAQIKTNGVVKYGGVNVATTTWQTFSYQWNTNPVTGLAWTWDDIDALQIGIEIAKYNCALVACTQVYVEIDYTAVAPAVELGASYQQLSPLGFNTYSAGQVRGG